MRGSVRGNDARAPGWLLRLLPRSLAGAAVVSSPRSFIEAAATAATASSNAAWLVGEVLVQPLILRTYCRAAAPTSDSGRRVEIAEGPDIAQL
jgi:hypothetical protein